MLIAVFLRVFAGSCRFCRFLQVFVGLRCKRNNNATSTAGPVMTLCKSRAHNDVVRDVGPGSYTTSHLGPSHGNVVFAARCHRADTTEVLLKVFSTFRETVPKARHLPTEVRGGGVPQSWYVGPTLWR